MTTTNIAFITIGEAPRLDLQKIYEDYFRDFSDVRQVGLLDDMTHEEAEEELGLDEGESHILTSRFIDGYQIIMSGGKVERKLQERVTQLEAQGVEVIGLLCTGEFPNLTSHKAQLIAAEDVVIPYIRATYPEGRIGIITPLEEQMGGSAHKWAMGDKGYFTFASPYKVEESAFIRAGQMLAQAEVDAIVFDCIGYNREMRRIVEDMTRDIPLYLSNELLFQHVRMIYNQMKEKRR